MPHTLHTRRRSPSVQPDSPWLITAFVGSASQGLVLSFKRPKEQRVVRMVCAIDRDAAGPIPRKREGNVR